MNINTSYKHQSHQRQQKTRLKPIILSVVLASSVLVLLWGCAGTYKPGEHPGDRDIGLPVFDYELIRLLSDKPDMTDLLVMVQIPYDNLQFVRQQDSFKANYEVMVVVTDSSGMVVDDHFSTHAVQEHNYYQTNSRITFSRANIFIALPPGKYETMVEVTDQESRERNRVSSTVHLEQSSPSCQLSSLILAKPSQDKTDPRNMIPLVGDFINRGETDAFLYYETSYSGANPMTVNWQLIHSPADTITTGTDTIYTDQQVTRNRIPMDLSNLSAGEYVANLETVGDECRRSASKRFRIQFEDLPQSITNIDEAIEQLRYIATDQEMETMRRAFRSAKLDLFREFWKNRDPTPGTPQNEQMDEYYRRVNYANLHFSTQRPGWMTDRGYVYIKYGEPSEVIRNLIPRNQKPYEIWIYHELNLEFVFQDRTGFGDYELVGPITEW
jgi:GWxTD domain-containing protein